ncbi:RNA-guided endonuclease TnpB family protein [Thermodesulfovibrio hydrogeniphilus]
MKEIEKEEYIPETPVIAIDLGLSTLFVTDRGDLFGRQFIDKLKYYDRRITTLASNRQRQGLKTRSKRYDRRVREFKEFLKNEINRCLNRIISIYKPAKIVVEKLNFQKSMLSRRMNRLLGWFGESLITQKLKDLEERYGIEIEYVNSAYSSQTCSVCGYVDKKNRTTQSEFKCRMCNTRLHADVNAFKKPASEKFSEGI